MAITDDEFEDGPLDDEEEEEEEEDDDEEDEDDDDIVEIMDPRTSTPPPPPMRGYKSNKLHQIPPKERWTAEQQAMVANLWEMLSEDANTEQHCYVALKRCNWNLSEAINHLLDSKDNPPTQLESSPLTFAEREALDISNRVQMCEDQIGDEQKDAVCNAVRHRLLYEDKKIAWSDGACAVHVCLRSLQHCGGDLDLISKPQRCLIVECLSKATSIMLDQSLTPSQEYFAYATSVVDSAIGIALLLLLEKRNALLIDVLNLCLQRDKNLWKSGQHYQKRRNVICGNNERVLNAILHEANWSAMPNEIAYNALLFARQANKSTQAASVVKARLIELLPLKNDRYMDLVFKELMYADKRAREEDAMENPPKRGRFDTLYHFWFNDFAMRPFAHTSSLEQRLFGLSQLERLTDLLESKRKQQQQVAPPPPPPQQQQQALFNAVVIEDEDDEVTEVVAPPPPPPPPPPTTTTPPSQEFTPELFCMWLNERDFIRQLVEISPMHTEILLRSKKVIKFLAAENEISALQLKSLWQLALAQHESCSTLLFDIICEVLLLVGSSSAVTFFHLLHGEDNAKHVLEFVQYMFKVNGGKLTVEFCSDTDKLSALIDLLWDFLNRFESMDDVFQGIVRLVPLLRQGMHDEYVDRAIEEIGKHDANTSFRFVLFLRKALEHQVRALQGDAEVDHILQVLVGELQHVMACRQDTAPSPPPMREMSYRLETIVYLWKQVSGHNIPFQQVHQVFSLLPGEELPLLLLREVIKQIPNKLSSGDLGRTFALIRPIWESIFDKQQAGNITELWTCFKCLFQALNQGGGVENADALRIAGEMIWQAALAPFASAIHEEASVLAIRDTNLPLSNVLSKTLFLLKQAIETADSNRVERCLYLVHRLSEDMPRRFGERPDHARSARADCAPIQVSITMNKDNKHQEERQFEGLNLNTTVQDMLRLVDQCDGGVGLWMDRYEVSIHPLYTLEQLQGRTFRCIPKDTTVAQSSPRNEAFSESARMTLARSDDLFILLHEIQMSPALTLQLKHEALRILQCLPSRLSVLSHFESNQQASCLQYVNPNWNYCDQVYRLEVLYSVLNPASVFNRDIAKSAKTRFVSTGGLRAVVSLLDTLREDLEAQFFWAGAKIVLRIVVLCARDIDSDLLPVCLQHLERILQRPEQQRLCSLAIEATCQLVTLHRAKVRAEQMDSILNSLVAKLQHAQHKEIRRESRLALEQLARVDTGLIWRKLVECVWPIDHADFLICLCHVKTTYPQVAAEHSAVRKAWTFAQLATQPLLAESLEMLTVLTDNKPTATEQDVKWLVDTVLFAPSKRAASINPGLLKWCTQLLILHCHANEANSLLLCATLRSKMQTTPLPEYNFEPAYVFREEEVPFAGLSNFGSTCYLNSLIQQFFMSPFIRKWIGTTAPPAAAAPAAAEETSSISSSEDAEKQRQSADLVHELRRVFAYLEFTKRRWIVPRQLVEMCKHLNLTHSVYSQNDVRDLCDKLVDFAECALMQESKHTEKLGGKVLHQNIKEGCPHPPTTFFDSFLMLELEIKGKLDLETSLRDYFAVEKLDEALQCEECKEKFPAHIRNELCTPLPQVLIIQLKRFHFDFDTFETIKLNDRLTFPMEIDLAKYTNHDSSNALDEVYTLCGVLVHRGQAFSGHYYSFSKDRSTNRWYKFNDEKVTAFDLKKMDEECFGGNLEANGYLLFYEPKQQQQQQQPSPVVEEQAEVAVDNEMLQIQSVLTSQEMCGMCAHLLHSFPLASNMAMEIQQVAMEVFFNWTCRMSTNQLPAYEFYGASKQIVQMLQAKLLEMMTSIRTQQLRRNLLHLAVLNCTECEPQLADLFVQLVSLGEVTKLPFVLEDMLVALMDLLVRKPAAREWMRKSNGLARLVHFYYGGGMEPSPFARAELSPFDMDIPQEDDNGLLLAQFDWNWVERMAKWQYSHGVNSVVMMQRLLELTASTLAVVISPHCRELGQQFSEVSSPLYAKLMRENPDQMLTWWIDLCSSNDDGNASQRIVNDLLHYICVEHDDTKYVETLIGVLSLCDAKQQDRVAMCFPALLTRSRAAMTKFLGLQQKRDAAPVDKPPQLAKLSASECEVVQMHCRLMAKLCERVPVFASQLAHQVHEQNMVAYDDDLTRLLLCYAETILLQPKSMRYEEADDPIRVLGDMAALPDGTRFLLTNQQQEQRAALLDEQRRMCLGARYLFDTKVNSCAMLLCVLDCTVKRTSTVVEFQCRMSSRFPRNAPLTALSNEPYVCIVLGKRPGDSIISLQLKTPFSLFQRVTVPYAEVFRRQQEMRDDHVDEEECNEDIVNEEADETVGGALRRSKRIKSRQDAAATHYQHQHIPGVVIKVLAHSVVVRLDSLHAGNNSASSSSVSQVVELADNDVPQNDPLVLEFPTNMVLGSTAPLCVQDHPFTIVRASIIPQFDPRKYGEVQTRPLSIPVYAGERIGLYRAVPLGFTQDADWLQIDNNSGAAFCNYLSQQQIAPVEGTVLSGTTVYRDNSRLGFAFRVRETE